MGPTSISQTDPTISRYTRVARPPSLQRLPRYCRTHLNQPLIFFIPHSSSSTRRLGATAERRLYNHLRIYRSPKRWRPACPSRISVAKVASRTGLFGSRWPLGYEQSLIRYRRRGTAFPNFAPSQKEFAVVGLGSPPTLCYLGGRGGFGKPHLLIV